MNYDAPYGCSVEAALAVVGGRWKPVLIFHLLERGTLRFNELKRLTAGITQRMLTMQLRELEKDGIVGRQVFAAVPPKVEYSLTPHGRTLEPMLMEMREWGARHFEQTVLSRQSRIEDGSTQAVSDGGTS